MREWITGRNQVNDSNGLSALGATVGTFNVDLTAPTALASLPNLTDSASGSTTYTLPVTYSAADGIDLTPLGNQDLEVTGPGGYDQFATLTNTAGSGNSRFWPQFSAPSHGSIRWS